eukprot:400574-Prorocentrum_minimum.AAC.1
MASGLPARSVVRIECVLNGLDKTQVYYYWGLEYILAVIDTGEPVKRSNITTSHRVMQSLLGGAPLGVPTQLEGMCKATNPPNQTRDARAELIEKVLGVLPRGAVHAQQSHVGNVLQGNVDVFAHLRRGESGSSRSGADTTGDSRFGTGRSLKIIDTDHWGGPSFTICVIKHALLVHLLSTTFRLVG